VRGDSDKLTTLLRGGMFPLAYVYPAGMRETRDLLRRRMHLVHIRGEAGDRESQRREEDRRHVRHHESRRASARQSDFEVDRPGEPGV